MRHLGQKPSVRPGWPSRDRPTGLPQFGQKRLSSGTCGLTMIACAASIAGLGGTVVEAGAEPSPRSGWTTPVRG